ncbi:hypothetical protein F5B20DRAFT_576674 [Whalleya microplaca]|nr:hypothetical protein F5B20DRAFT_576674 [Whalleya microplaca]
MVVELDSTTPPLFPRFAELPAELRILIWKFSLPRRVFEIRKETVPVKRNGEPDTANELDHDAWRVRSSDLAAVLLAPPALLSVCREARKVASRFGSWKCVGSRPRGTCRVIRLETWFDPSTDILCFDEASHKESTGPRTEQNPAITRFYFCSSPASPICVSLAALSGTSGRFLVEQWQQRKRGFWRGVPQYLFYHDSIVMHLSRSPQVQDIFGKGLERCHVLLVDAHDHKKLRRLRKIYIEESDPAYFDKRVANWLRDIVDPEEGYVEQSDIDLKNLWLKGQPDVPSSAIALSEDQMNIRMRSLIEPGALLNAIQEFDHEHPWCQEVLSDIPPLQLVIHFRLCITNHNSHNNKENGCQRRKLHLHYHNSLLQD